MRRDRSGLRCAVGLVISVAFALALPCAADGDMASGRHEPSAPNLLELIPIAHDAAGWIVEVEAIVRPVVDGEVELEVVSPAGLRFDSSAPSSRFRVRRGGDVRRERLRIARARSGPFVVRVRAKLLTAEGDTWLSVDRELHFDPPKPDRSSVRVPVVRSAPDGSKTVEYMRRDRAGGGRHAGDDRE